MGKSLVNAENTNLKAGEGSTSSLKFNAGVEFTLLGQKFTAMMEKGTNLFRFVLLPTPGAKNKAYSIADICSGITESVNNLVTTDGQNSPDTTIDTASVVSSVQAYVPSASDAYKVYLNQIFLYFCRDSSTSKPTNTFEYAFSISIKKDDVRIDGINIVSLDSVSINIWDTDRLNILEKMAMGNMDELLKA